MSSETKRTHVHRAIKSIETVFEPTFAGLRAEYAINDFAVKLNKIFCKEPL
jgi:hypothetical protein